MKTDKPAAERRDRAEPQVLEEQPRKPPAPPAAAAPAAASRPSYRPLGQLRSATGAAERRADHGHGIAVVNGDRGSSAARAPCC